MPQQRQLSDSSAQATDAALLGLVNEWAAAERAGDDDAIAHLLMDDFRLVGPLGFILTKDQMRQRYRSGDLKHTAFAVEDPTVRTYEDCAIIIAVQDQQTTYRDRDASGRFRITLVAVRDRDHWRFAGMHLSPIASAPPQAS